MPNLSLVRISMELKWKIQMHNEAYFNSCEFIVFARPL